MSLGIIIQARTGSTRLPKKMLLPFYESYSILELLILRIKAYFNDMNIVLATTINSNDDEIYYLSVKHNVKCYRGDEEDVLYRFICAADNYNITKIIRVCADNPFLDMNSINILVKKISDTNFDYISFATNQGIPTIKTHFGFWAEAVTISALKKVNSLTDEKLYHEHVTNFIYSNLNEFNCHFLKIDSDVEQMKIRLTLDTLSDFELQMKIYSMIIESKKEFTITNVIEILKNQPQFFKLMNEEIQNNLK